MRKKLLAIILLICAISIVSCSQKEVNTYAGEINFDDTTKITNVKKKFTSHSSEIIGIEDEEYDLISYEDIDFITIEDMYKLLQNIDSKLNIYRLDRQPMEDIFDTENNMVNITIYREEEIDHRHVIGLDAYYDYKVIDNTSRGYSYKFKVDLTNFGVKYLNYEDKIYFPLMMTNYCFFDTSIVLYPYSNTEYRVNASLKSLELDIIEEDINNKQLSYETKIFTYYYLENYLEQNYPYYGIKKDNIEPIMNELYTNIRSLDNNEFYAYLYKIIDALEDYHSYFVKAKYNIDGVKLDELQPVKYNYLQSKKELMEESGEFEASIYKDINGVIDYVFINDFEKSNESFIEHITDNILLSDTKKEALIIDIRFNPGGYSTLANDLLKYLGNDSFSLYYCYKTPTYISDNQQIQLEKQVEYQANYKEVVLLTNSYTYSAANNLACWFKELEAGTVIGETTGGGGSSMTLHVLPDGSVINISSPLLIYTDNQGKPIELGVEPDIEVKDNFNNGGDAVLEEAVNYIYNTLGWDINN